MHLNPYESPKSSDLLIADPRQKWPRLQAMQLFGLALVAIVVTFLTLLLSAAFIDAIRPVGGNPNTTSGSGYAAGSLILAIFGPWFASFPIIKQANARIYFLICLAVAAVTWYLTGFDDMLNKAWERGL